AALSGRDVQSVAMTARRSAVGIALAGCLVAAGCAPTLSGSSITTTTPSGTSEQVPVELSRPEGAGPFPAVVIMHDCSGLGPRSSGAPGRWAKELVGRGYVVLMPDSFTTRGHPDGVCTDASRSRDDVSPARRIRDAYAGLAYLRTLPYVSGARGRAAPLEQSRRVSTCRAAADPHRRQGRLDAGGALPPADRGCSAGRLSGHDQDLSRRVPL